MTAGQQQDDTDLLSQLRLGLANTYYSMAQVFGLKRLQGLLQARTAQVDSGHSNICDMYMPCCVQ